LSRSDVALGQHVSQRDTFDRQLFLAIRARIEELGGHAVNHRLREEPVRSLAEERQGNLLQWMISAYNICRPGSALRATREDSENSGGKG
jgi:hypothetical protein